MYQHAHSVTCIWCRFWGEPGTTHGIHATCPSSTELLPTQSMLTGTQLQIIRGHFYLSPFSQESFIGIHDVEVHDQGWSHQQLIPRTQVLSTQRITISIFRETIHYVPKLYTPLFIDTATKWTALCSSSPSNQLLHLHISSPSQYS